MLATVLSLLLLSTLFFKMYFHIKLDVIHERFEEPGAWKLPYAYIVPYSGNISKAYIMDKVACHVCYIFFITTALFTMKYIIML